MRKNIRQQIQADQKATKDYFQEMEHTTDAQGKDWTYFTDGDDECMECHEHRAVWACTQTGHELCGWCFKTELKIMRERGL